MPEGHSLRRLAIAFEQAFVGSYCGVSSPQGRFAAGAALLDGKTMVAAQSVGKHLFLGFEAADLLWLHIHLGLYGACRFGGVLPPIAAQEIAIGAPRNLDPDEAIKVSGEGEQATGQGELAWPPSPIGQVRVRIMTEQSVADVNGPNTCRVITEEEKLAVLARLGSDPLSNSAAAKHRFIDAVRGSKRAVGELVLDQSIIAGVGNIYRAEGLFRQGISPFRAGSNVSVKRLGALWDDFVFLLEDGVATGIISTVRTGEEAIDPESERWYVYQRTGRPCLQCAMPIRMKEVQSRRLYWCANCQR